MGERRVPTVDELFATLKNSSMPTVIVEGRDDIVFYRKVEDELSDLGIDILSAGNKDKVLELREKILSENLSIPIAFIVDKDLWVNYGVPTEYQDSLITTNGYSIENDLFLDGDLLLLLDSDELLDFKDDLDVFIKWYALAINRHVNDKKTIYDEISSFRYHPNKLLDDKSFYIKDYLIMALAIFIYTIGLTGFIMPNQVVSGGLAGAALLLNYATGINVSSTIFVVNVLLLIVAFRPLGKKFVINTIIGAGMLTVGVRVGEGYLKPYFLANPPVHDPFIAIVLGGIFMGVALGMVYSVNGSTGGVDIIGFLVTKYFKIRISRILLYVDVLIVLSSIFILKGYTIEKMVLGLILLPVMYQAVDVIMNGAKQAIQVIILSKKYEEIATHINTELKRGCTVVDGTGWYTKNPQKVIIVFARRGEGTTIFRLVNSIDPDAFVTRTNVEAVYGKGFEKFS